MRTTTALAGLTVLAVLAAGCSDSDDDGSDTADATPTASETAATETAEAEPTTSPEAALEDAYRTYIAAFLSGDGATAYGLLSERCREKTALSEFAAGSEAAAELYGEVDYEIKSVTVDGNEGRVSAKFPVAALQGGDPEGTLWLLEDGEWRSDKCGD